MSLREVEHLWQVNAGYFVAGVEVDRYRIVRRAPPILAWAIGRPFSYLEKWCLRRKAKVTRVW